MAKFNNVHLEDGSITVFARYNRVYLSYYPGKDKHYTRQYDTLKKCLESVDTEVLSLIKYS